jgi:hypothetical protein
MRAQQWRRLRRRRSRRTSAAVDDLGGSRRCTNSTRVERGDCEDGESRSEGNRAGQPGDGHGNHSERLCDIGVPEVVRPTAGPQHLRPRVRNRCCGPCRDDDPQTQCHLRRRAVRERDRCRDRADADGTGELGQQPSTTTAHVERQLDRDERAGDEQWQPVPSVGSERTDRHEGDEHEQLDERDRAATLVRWSHRPRHRSTRTSLSGVRATNANIAAAPSARPGQDHATRRPSRTGSSVRLQPPCSVGIATARSVDRSPAAIAALRVGAVS